MNPPHPSIHLLVWLHFITPLAILYHHHHHRRERSLHLDEVFIIRATLHAHRNVSRDRDLIPSLHVLVLLLLLRRCCCRRVY